MDEKQEVVGRDDDVNLSDLIKVNDLKYVLPRGLSTISKRQISSSQFQNQSYAPGATMTCFVSTGENFVMGKNSYIRMGAYGHMNNGDAPTDAKLESGSILNLFKNCVYTTSSGTEVERNIDVNDYQHCKLQWDYDVDYTLSVGTHLLGANTKDIKLSTTDANDETKGAHEFCVPMGHIFGCWNTNKLMPWSLCSGSKIEIVLESVARAFKSADAETYTVVRPELYTDQYTLTDMVLKTINESSASGGLGFRFESYDVTKSAFDSATLNLSSQKALAKANRAWLKTRISADESDGKKDSFACEGKYKTSQFNIGGLYLPNQPLKSAGSNEGARLYMNTLYSFNRVNKGNPGATVASHPIVSCTLERSSNLPLSGVSILSGRYLNAEVTYTDAAAARAVSMYVEHDVELLIFLDKVVVKE